MYLHYQMTQVRQDEIARRIATAQREDDVREITRPRLTVNRRVARAVATLGVCLAASTALTISAHASSAQTISQLEAKGFVQTSCTVSGIRMHDFHTGQTVTVR
jgi:hypothetical protein